MSGARDVLVESAVRLRSQAPAAWDQFIVALRTRAAEAATQMVQAPADHIFKAQGRALAYQELVGEMINAVWTYEQLEEKKKHGQQRATTGSWTSAPS